MLKTYQGSCHCGAVRFESDIDLSQGTIRCNCSICRKARYWPAIVQPAAFRLLTSEGALTRYQFASHRDQHFHCKTCGMRPFGIGQSPRWGEFYSVNISCLDDASDAELAAAPITFLNGRDDIWDAAPAETRHL